MAAHAEYSCRRPDRRRHARRGARIRPGGRPAGLGGGGPAWPRGAGRGRRRGGRAAAGRTRAGRCSPGAGGDLSSALPPGAGIACRASAREPERRRARRARSAGGGPMTGGLGRPLGGRPGGGAPRAAGPARDTAERRTRSTQKPLPTFPPKSNIFTAPAEACIIRHCYVLLLLIIA